MKAYNPLEKENLGKSVADSLLIQSPVPLGCLPKFHGAGVYAIYYNGDFKDYLSFKKWNPNVEDLRLPIYVGKAVPTGGRKGIVDPSASSKGSSLFSRLDEHRKSIELAHNLDIKDFWCRYLVVDDIWIPLGESLLIQRYRPLWNSVVDGFGNHDPGSGRYKGARPNWDAIHPGREWALRCAPPTSTEDQIREQIAIYWDSYTLVE